MELDLGPEAARFRQETRDWIAGNAPDGLPGLIDWNTPPMTAGDHSGHARAQESPQHAEWERRLLAERMICPQWPERFGGRGQKR